MPVELKRLTAAEARRALDALADVLCDAVDGGDSVSFMDGFGTDDARAFYASLLPELEGGTRRRSPPTSTASSSARCSSSTPGRRTRSTGQTSRSCSCIGVCAAGGWGGR